MHRVAPRTSVGSLLGLYSSSPANPCSLPRASSSGLHTSSTQFEYRSAGSRNKGNASHMHKQTERLLDVHKMARSPPGARIPRSSGGADRNANWSITPTSKFGSRYSPPSNSATAAGIQHGVRQTKQAPIKRDERAAKRMREEAKLVALKAKEMETHILGLPVELKRPLQPGDAIEVRSMFAQLGVVLGMPPSANGKAAEEDMSAAGVGQEIVVLSPSGNIELWRQTDVMLVLPQLASPALARKSTPISNMYILQAPTVPDQHETERLEEPVDIERFEARSTLCARMRALSRMAERERQRLLPAFRSVCLEDSEEPGALAHAGTNTFTTSHVAKLLDAISKRPNRTHSPGGLSQPTLLATHQLLMMYPSRFLADPLSHIKTQLFTLRLPAERRALERIDAWLKAPPGSEGAAIVSSFAERARKVLAWRQSGCGGLLEQTEGSNDALPSLSRATQAQGPGVEWTEEDVEILRFLRATLGVRRLIQGNVHGAAAMALLKHCGAHVNVEPASEGADVPIKVPDALLPYGGDTACAGQDLQHALVSRFLEDVGVLAPWQNLALLEAGFEPNTSGAEGVVESGATTQHDAIATPTVLPGQEEKRRDFGSLPVYVIDDATAYELDDGISFEPADEAGETWVHVHVADPTAVLSPNDDLVQLAKRQQNSLYLPEARWPLLPDALINAGRLGLGSKFEDERAADERAKYGLRALTFSARLEDATGKILDYSVSPSLLRDVRITTYVAVNEILLGPPSQDKLSMVWQMQTLERISTAVLRRRVDRGAFQATGARPLVSISPLPLPLPPAYSTPQTHDVFSGFPRIKLELQPELTLHEFTQRKRSQTMVAECMILAGRVAGATAVDRRIPLVWRTQEPSTATDQVKLMAMRDENGEISYKELLKGNIALSSGGSAAYAAPHFAMGLTATASPDDATGHGGYARATSPLRRFPDLVAHWQLKASLSGKPLPWDLAALKLDLARFIRMDAWAKSIEKTTGSFWAVARLAQVLNKQRTQGRASLDVHEAALLGPHEATITLRDVRQSAIRMDVRVRVVILALGLNAECVWDAKRGIPESGQCYMVNVVDVTRTGMRTAVLARPLDL